MDALVIRQNGFVVRYEPVCRLYQRDDTGLLVDLREEYELPQLGGVRVFRLLGIVGGR